jgi:hypothetical protein
MGTPVMRGLYRAGERALRLVHVSAAQQSSFVWQCVEECGHLSDDNITQGR